MPPSLINHDESRVDLRRSSPPTRKRIVELGHFATSGEVTAGGSADFLPFNERGKGESQLG